MLKRTLSILIPWLLLLHLSSCNQQTSLNTPAISEDPGVIAKGEASFNKYCGGCHNFKQDGIGPQLGGITASVPTEWIERFVQNPTQVIESGDHRALDLLKKYKVTMPSFSHLDKDEINSIIAFLNTHAL